MEDDALVADVRDAAVSRYGFAIPTPEAMELLRAHSPNGIVEIGAGTGYWAMLAARLGVDVRAFDIAPPPSADNPWFAGSAAWYPVERESHHVVSRFPDRTLLIIWPTKNEIWPVETLDLYAASGGKTVAHVGEGPGEKTGDTAFHSRLGELESCLQCVHGIVDAACSCDDPRQWTGVARLELPHWPGCDDDLGIYERRP